MPSNQFSAIEQKDFYQLCIVHSTFNLFIRCILASQAKMIFNKKQLFSLYKAKWHNFFYTDRIQNFRLKKH